ncbi:MAG TPA: hypothetical protein VHB02_13305 [Acidimicrobiales bacterium]|nr:hypothetical protein [Acidimicrobiales bacterium]
MGRMRKWATSVGSAAVVAAMAGAGVAGGAVTGGGVAGAVTAPVATDLHSMVQMGDSIASGEGTLYGYTYTASQQIWTGGVTSPVWTGQYQTCHDSHYAYGQVVATFEGATFTQFACSGATFSNGITAPQVESTRTFRPAQFGTWTTQTDLNATYDKADPDLVTVTLGADDVQFVKIVEGCVENAAFNTPPTECIPSNPGPTVQQYYFDEITTLKANLASLAEWIEARGQADGKVPKVVFATYADPLPANGTTCPDTLDLKGPQLDYMNTLLLQLDQLEVQTIQGLGNANLATVTNYDAFAGHTWCTADPWAYGLSVLTKDNFDSKAPFHPTPTGQAVLASRVEPVVGQLFRPATTTTQPLKPLHPAQPLGYVLASANGGAFAYGGVPFAGSVPGAGVNVSNVVGVSPIPHSTGYRMVGSDGGVYAFGGALFEGSLPGIGIHVDDVVGMAGSPDGNGYWLVDKTGGVYTFGASPFYGSLPGLGIHVDNVVGMVSTADAKGYWLVGSDGGVYAFGDARFSGSAAGLVHRPITGIARTDDGRGYWLVGSDGGVFAFGDAPFAGSLPASGVAVHDIRGISRTPGGNGYWLVGADGGVFAFGDAPFQGSAVGVTGGRPVVGIAGM